MNKASRPKGTALHGTTSSRLRSLFARLCLLGLFLRSSPLAFLGHLSQLVVIQLGFDVCLVVAGVEASVVCFADGGKKLVQVFDGIAQCIKS